MALTMQQEKQLVAATAQALGVTPAVLGTFAKWRISPNVCRLSLDLTLFSFEVLLTLSDWQFALSYQYPKGDPCLLYLPQEHGDVTAAVNSLVSHLDLWLTDGYRRGLQLAAKAICLSQLERIRCHPGLHFFEGQRVATEARERLWDRDAVSHAWKTWLMKQTVPDYMHGYKIRPWLVTAGTEWGVEPIHFLTISPTKGKNLSVDAILVRSCDLDYSRYSVYRITFSEGLEHGARHPVAAEEALFRERPLLEALTFAGGLALQGWDRVALARETAACEQARAWLLCLE